MFTHIATIQSIYNLKPQKPWQKSRSYLKSKVTPQKPLSHSNRN